MRVRAHLTAIAGAARDHDCAGTKLAAVLQRDCTEWRGVRERGSLGGNQDLRAELLRLNECATCQRLAGYSGREAQVILDAGAGPCLAAKRAAVEDRDTQAFRSRIHRARESRRTRADDGDIEDFAVRQRIHHSEIAGERVFVGREQDRAVGAEHEHVVVRASVLREQRRHRGVVTRVDRVVGLTIAAEKVLQPMEVRGLRRTDQNGAAPSGLDQPDAAQDQRPHDPLAELRFGHDQCPQSIGGHEQCLHVVVGIRVDERHAAG